MPVKVYKPNTAARRISSVQDFSDITKFEPEKKLIVFRKQNSGRNASGRITVRHRGGGARRYTRIVDFLRARFDVSATVTAIEYDPSRGARLALIQYPDGEKRYMIAPHGLGVGATVLSSKKAVEPKPGNRMPLEHIPIGLLIHAIELKPGGGARFVRGAGTAASLLAVDGPYAHIKLPSGEVRLVPKEAAATIGQVGNPDWRLVRWGSAGRTRRRGRRPQVRGKVMNPVDHPHGGGEGKHPIGMKHPKTPWGKPALGVKTRNPKKWSAHLILKRRT